MAIPLIIGLLVALSMSSSIVVHEGGSPEGPVTGEGSTRSGSDDDHLNGTQVYTELPGPTNDASFGTYLGYAGDITGDGCDDILQWRLHVSDYHYMVMGSRERQFLPQDVIKYDGVRWFLPVGDIDGDGHDDVVCSLDQGHNPFSIRVESLPARVHVRYGTTSGLPRSDDAVLSIGPVQSNGSKWDLLTYEDAGDVNGDGYSDLLVLAGLGRVTFRYDRLTHPQEIQLYYGSKKGFESSPGWTADLVNDAVNWSHIGIMGHADFNGDNCSDIIICLGSSNKDPDAGSYPVYRSVTIHYGSTSGLSLVPNVTIEGNTTEAYLRNVEPIRFNNDSLDDLAITYHQKGNVPWYENPTEFTVHLGTSVGISGDASYSLTSNLTWPIDSFLPPYTGAIFLDLNGNGRDDMVSWTQDYINKTSEEPGRPDWEYIPHMNIHLSIFFNDQERFPIEPDLEYSLWNITHCYPRLFRGDFDGDGSHDLAVSCGGGYIGKPPYGQGVWFYGRLFIIFGSGMTSLKDPFFHSGGPQLYAGYQAYDFMVRDDPRGFGGSRKIQLTLDSGDANITLAWEGDASTSRWSVSHGSDLVSLESTASDLIIDEDRRTTWFRFKVLFDWDWPHERPCDVHIEFFNATGSSYTYERAEVFSVENDLDLTGEMQLSGDIQGELEPGGWVAGDENLDASGLKVVYEGSDDVHPPAGTCLVVMSDDDGDSSVQPNEPDGVVELSITADDETDLSENITVRLQDLPGTARAVSNVTFSLRVDADPPRLEDPIPDSDDWHGTDRVLVSITANDTGTSGVDMTTLEYSYLGPSGVKDWSQKDLALKGHGPEVEAVTYLPLPDGVGYWVQWRVRDLVGNPYTISNRFPIKVDTRNVSFTNPFPQETDWQNSTDVYCGVTIRDLDGSGIDVDTIEYRFSLHNVSDYGEWTRLNSGQVDSQLVTIQVLLELSEGPYNYVQWRAADIAGNGLTLSPHYRVQVDTTPVIYSAFWPTEILNTTEALVGVRVIVDPYHLDIPISLCAYRFRTGDGPYSNWRATETDTVGWNIYLEAHVVGLADGVENYVQFQVYDPVHDGPVLSPEYQLRVDVSGPLFTSMLPEEGDIQPEPVVIVTVVLYDALAGVDTNGVHFRYATGETDGLGTWNLLPVEQSNGGFTGSVAIPFVLGNDNAVQFKCLDLLGNEAVSESLRVWVNRPPLAVIHGLVEGKNYSVGEAVQLSAEGSSDPDGHDLTFEWYLEGSLVGTDASLATGDLLGAGVHTITLLVRDPLGAEDSISVRMVVDPEEMVVDEGPAPMSIGLIIILIVLLVIVGTIIYLKRRDRTDLH